MKVINNYFGISRLFTIGIIPLIIKLMFTSLFILHKVLQALIICECLNKNLDRL